MADVFKGSEVGARYARALFELALDQNLAGAIDSDVAGLKAMIAESRELRSFLTSPIFDADTKGRALAALADAAQFNPLTRKFLAFVAAQRRTGALRAVLSAYEALSAAHRGVVFAEVTTAVALTAAQKQGLASALRLSLGKDPEITTRVDPAILGGVKVRVGSRLYDASLKSKLDSLKFALKRA